MEQVFAAINTFTKPIHAVYVKAFNANRYAADSEQARNQLATLYGVDPSMISLAIGGA